MAEPKQGFTGEGPVPIVDPNIIDQMADAYRVPYEMITGERLPQDPQSSDPDSIRQAVLEYFSTGLQILIQQFSL